MMRVRHVQTQPKSLFFVASARKDLKAFPQEVLREVGFALHLAELGETGDATKPMRGFGGVSVMEIVSNYDTDTYRAVYTAKLAGAVYVLHCFQKKSKRGIATTKADIDLIRARLKEAERLHAGWIAEQNEQGDQDETQNP